MILCIVQARTSSTRLPEKVLKIVCGKTMLQHEIERLSYSKYIDRIVVATTAAVQDDRIAEICRALCIECYRGSENDVLDRFYQTARSLELGEQDLIVRITGDCPLIDPAVVDKTISTFLDTKADYASNANPPTYPDGLDVEVFKYIVLQKAWMEAKLLSEREHVTPYMRNHTELFNCINVQNSEDLSHHRWTLDEEEDLKLIERIYECLYQKNKIFSMKDILDLFNRDKDLIKINKHYVRNEGYSKSLQNDRVLGGNL